MANIPSGTMRDWKDKDVVNAADYKQEREILRTAVNDNNTRVSSLESKNLDSRATSLEGRMTTAEADVNALELWVDSVAFRTTTAEGDIDSLEGRMSTAETNISNRYTKEEVNSALAQKTDLSGDHKGTWQGLTPGQASEAINGARLDVLEAQNVESATLANGSNTISSVVQEAPVKLISTVGKTDVVNMKGIFGVKNPTVEANGKREVVETTLHALNGVQDELFRDADGKLKKRTRFKEMALDGSHSWTFMGDSTGYKRVGIPISGGVNSSQTASKYDGKILTPSYSAGDFTGTSFDKVVFDTGISTTNMQISIADTDSGWGESYTPTSDEIKAYFNGWKMYESTAGGASTYNGTGTKRWIGRNTDGTIDGTNTSATLPTGTYQNFTPYKLVYQLATERVEEVSTSGQVVLEEGNNTVELKQGVIVKERANPQTASSDGNTYINLVSYQGVSNVLKHKVNKILKVFKNNIEDNKWSFGYSGSAFGNERAAIANADYDPTATYYVTYEILPELTAKAEPMQVEYASSLKSLVESNTRQLAEHEGRLDGLHTVFAKKVQEAWIPVVLQNGWQKYMGRGYKKDDLDTVFVELFLQNGTTTAGTTLFTLPNGYRPSTTFRFNAVTYSTGSDAKPLQMSVETDGVIKPTFASLTYIVIQMSFKI